MSSPPLPVSVSLPEPESSRFAASLPISASLPDPLRAFSIVTPLAMVKPP